MAVQGVKLTVTVTVVTVVIVIVDCQVLAIRLSMLVWVEVMLGL